MTGGRRREGGAKCDELPAVRQQEAEESRHEIAASPSTTEETRSDEGQKTENIITGRRIS